MPSFLLATIHPSKNLKGENIMGERTINGTALSKIRQALVAEIPVSSANWSFDSRTNQPSYIKADAFERRFNEVIGPLNYSRVPELSQLVTIEDKTYVQTLVKVTIYDDNGDVVCERAANGVSMTGNGDPKSNYASAESEAFKQLCFDMGIGSAQQKQAGYVKKSDKIESSKAASRGTGGDGAGMPTVAALPKGEQHIKAVLKEDMSGSGSFISAKAEDESGREVVVKIFRNKFQEIEKTVGDVNRYISGLKKGVTMTFLGEYREYKGEIQCTLWDVA